VQDLHGVDGAAEPPEQLAAQARSRFGHMM
jgi:hypothetical protein